MKLEEIAGTLYALSRIENVPCSMCTAVGAAVCAECEYPASCMKTRDRLEEMADAVGDAAKRLMPEGMEWPRFEDGEPVRFGDLVGDRGGAWMEHPVDEVLFRDDGTAELFGDGNSICCERGESVVRIVLAADGEPLEVGKTVWRDDGEELEVLYLRPDGLVDCCGEIERPERLTNQRPVLDADGVPIKKGDTVWWLEHTVAFTVVSPHETHDNDGHELKCGHTVEIAREGHEPHLYVHPESLHHTKPEPPDSWERIEEDATLPPREYYARYVGHDVGLKDDEEVNGAFGESLVRRCRSLAERGELREEIVRCSDCAHASSACLEEDPDALHCIVMDVLMSPDGFCSFGERKEGR